MNPQPANPGENQDARDALGRFLPGVSGNPTGAGGGRPKGSVQITALMRELLDADPATARKLAQSILSQAARGNGVAIRSVLDRLDGPLSTKVDVSFSGEDLANLNRLGKGFEAAIWEYVMDEGGRHVAMTPRQRYDAILDAWSVTLQQLGERGLAALPGPLEGGFAEASA